MAARVTVVLAVATTRDLVRRPGFVVGVAALVALLAVLPRLGNPAASASDNAALATELALATLAVVAAVAGGALGVRAADPDDGVVAAELRTAPHGTFALVASRVLGIVATLAVLIAVVGGITAIVWAVLGGGARWPEASALAIAVGGMLASAAAFAAIGLLVGVCAPAQVAHVVVLGFVVATRALPISSARDSGVAAWLGALLPQTSRLDFAREVAFGREPSAAAFALALGAAIATCAAALLAAAWRIERRECA